MLFLFLTSIGALTVAKQRATHDYEVLRRPTLRQIEMFLDQQNEQLDRELAELLVQHRQLSAGSVVDKSMMLDADLYEQFARLEEEDGKGS